MTRMTWKRDGRSYKGWMGRVCVCHVFPDTIGPFGSEDRCHRLSFYLPGLHVLSPTPTLLFGYSHIVAYENASTAMSQAERYMELWLKEVSGEQ